MILHRHWSADCSSPSTAPSSPVLEHPSHVVRLKLEVSDDTVNEADAVKLHTCSLYPDAIADVIQTHSQVAETPRSPSSPALPGAARGIIPSSQSQPPPPPTTTNITASPPARPPGLPIRDDCPAVYVVTCRTAGSRRLLRGAGRWAAAVVAAWRWSLVWCV